MTQDSRQRVPLYPMERKSCVSSSVLQPSFSTAMAHLGRGELGAGRV